MMELHILSLTSTAVPQLITLDLNSLIILNYLKLYKSREEFTIVNHHASSSTTSLPYLKIDNLIINTNSILIYLSKNSSMDQKVHLSELNQSESSALQCYLSTNLLPLVLHSLYSLPANWNSLRPQLSQSLPYPAKLYIPEQLRTQARETVDLLQPNWWGLGGEVEKEEEEERKAKRLLLETGSEAWKERQDEERKSGKKVMEKTFGRIKIQEIAKKLFKALENKLADSTTSYFFSSPSPTSLDVQVSSLLSVLLLLPLPQPILASQLHDSFPRLLAHSTLVQTALALIQPTKISDSPDNSSLSNSIKNLIPSLDNLLPHFFQSKNDHTPLPSLLKKSKSSSKTASELKEENTFKRNRLIFLGVVAVGSLTWGVTTGALGLLLGSKGGGEMEEEEEEEEGEWEVVEEYIR